MKQKIVKIVLCCVFITSIFILFQNQVFAVGSIDEIMQDADNFLNQSNEVAIGEEDMKPFSNTLYIVLVIIGTIIAVIVGIVLGIQYMMSSVEQKAESKEKLVSYVIGCAILLGAFGIWQVVVNVFQDTEQSLIAEANGEDPTDESDGKEGAEGSDGSEGKSDESSKSEEIPGQTNEGNSGQISGNEGNSGQESGNGGSSNKEDDNKEDDNKEDDNKEDDNKEDDNKEDDNKEDDNKEDDNKENKNPAKTVKKITLNKKIIAIDGLSSESWKTSGGTQSREHKNRTAQLTVNIEPKVPNIEIKWSIERGQQVVSVSKNGKITGLNGGEAVVRATVKGNKKVYAECKVYVLHGLYENVKVKNTVQAKVRGSTDEVQVKANTTVELLGILKSYGSNKDVKVRLNSGKIVTMNSSNLQFVSYHIDDALSKSVYEDYINNGNFTSKTNYLLWVNQGTERIMLFQKNSKGKWELKEIHETATGMAETAGFTGVHFDFEIRDFNTESGIGHAIHMQRIETKEYFGNTVHIGNIPHDSKGHPIPASHGCPHITTYVRDLLYNQYNKGSQNKLIGTRVIYF